MTCPHPSCRASGPTPALERLGLGLLILATVLLSPACPAPVEDDDAGDDDSEDDDAGDDDSGDDDAGDDDTGDDDTGDDDSGDDDSGSGDDQDGDGYSVADGDCDDTDPAIHPGASDVCDEVDNDCDGAINEDSPGYDQYEPNEAVPTDLGDLTGSEETINAFIHEPADEDHFSLYVEDGMIGYFYVDAELITVPAGLDLALELILVEDADGGYVGTVEAVDDGGESDGEFLSFGGSAFHDDSGTYELVVAPVSGFHCSVPYILVLDIGG